MRVPSSAIVGEPSDGVVKAAHDRGLLVRAWHGYEAFPPKGVTAAACTRYLLDGIGLDGLFTEFPGVALENCRKGCWVDRIGAN